MRPRVYRMLPTQITGRSTLVGDAAAIRAAPYPLAASSGQADSPRGDDTPPQSTISQRRALTCDTARSRVPKIRCSATLRMASAPRDVRLFRPRAIGPAAQQFRLDPGAVHNEQFPHARDPLPNSDHTTILAPDACPRISREWCGRQQSEKESLRRCRQMDAKHADGPETGMVIHGGHRTTKPGGAAAMRQPRSHLRVLRTSACICGKLLLASCALFRTVPSGCASAGHRSPAFTLTALNNLLEIFHGALSSATPLQNTISLSTPRSRSAGASKSSAGPTGTIPVGLMRRGSCNSAA